MELTEGWVMWALVRALAFNLQGFESKNKWSNSSLRGSLWLLCWKETVGKQGWNLRNQLGGSFNNPGSAENSWTRGYRGGDETWWDCGKSLNVGLIGYLYRLDVGDDRRLKNDSQDFWPKPLSEMVKATGKAGLGRKIRLEFWTCWILDVYHQTSRYRCWVDKRIYEFAFGRKV